MTAHGYAPDGTKVTVSISRKKGIMQLTGSAKCICGVEYRQTVAYSYPRQHNSTTVSKLKANVRTIVRTALRTDHMNHQEISQPSGWNYDPNAPVLDTNHLSGSAVDINAAAQVAFPFMESKRGGILHPGVTL